MENHIFLMGKSTISMAIFNSYICKRLPGRVGQIYWPGPQGYFTIDHQLFHHQPEHKTTQD